MKEDQNPNLSNDTRPVQAVKRFYFFEYFFVLLSAVRKYSDKENIFEHFKNLKQEKGLGESKYRKLTSEGEHLNKYQEGRYRYTFELVIEESIEYGLIELRKEKELLLTKEGEVLLADYEQRGNRWFNRELFKKMEKSYGGFRHLVESLYDGNKHPQRSGLFILPIHSPLQLGLERSNIKTAKDVHYYASLLHKRLEKDIEEFIGRKEELNEPSSVVLSKITEAGLISKVLSEQFEPKRYNAITKRFRDFWINYFLRDIYGYKHSLTTFDIWTFRGKQAEVVHATEVYPGTSGKVVYPLSVVSTNQIGGDFEKVCSYADGNSLFLHQPGFDDDIFVDQLVQAYFDTRRSVQTYFVNLIAVRELVCYRMKISEQSFQAFLEESYKLNLSNNLKIKISLEVDKLPEETKMMYLKREPVMVAGKHRNIIAIDLTKGRR